ncbi:MAG: hypothetical protein ACLR23_07985 [Clostridia bacterium]
MLRPGHINKKTLRWLLPVAFVVLSVFLLQAVSSQRAYHIQGITPQDGVLDIRDADVSSCVLNIVNDWDFYPAALYTSEDFASGAAAVKAGPEESASDTPTEPTACGFWHSRTSITPFAAFRWIMPAACSSTVLRLRPLAGWRTMRRILYPRWAT